MLGPSELTECLHRQPDTLPTEDDILTFFLCRPLKSERGGAPLVIHVNSAEREKLLKAQL